MVLYREGNLPKHQYIHPDGRVEVATIVEYEEELQHLGFRPLEEVVAEYHADPRIEKVDS